MLFRWSYKFLHKFSNFNCDRISYLKTLEQISSKKPLNNTVFDLFKYAVRFDSQTLMNLTKQVLKKNLDKNMLQKIIDTCLNSSFQKLMKIIVEKEIELNQQGVWVMIASINYRSRRDPQMIHLIPSFSYSQLVLKYWKSVNQLKSTKKIFWAVYSTYFINYFALTHREIPEFLPDLQTAYIKAVNFIFILEDNFQLQSILKLFPSPLFNNTHVSLIQDTFIKNIYHRLSFTNIYQIEKSLAYLSRFRLSPTFYLKKVVRFLTKYTLKQDEQYLSYGNIVYYLVRKLGLMNKQDMKEQTIKLTQIYCKFVENFKKDTQLIVNGIVQRKLNKLVEIVVLQQKICPQSDQSQMELNRISAYTFNQLKLNMKYTVKILRLYLTYLHLNPNADQKYWNIYQEKIIIQLFQNSLTFADILPETIHIHQIQNRQIKNKFLRRLVRRGRVAFQKILEDIENFNQVREKMLHQLEINWLHFQQLISGDYENTLMKSYLLNQSNIFLNLQNDQSFRQNLMKTAIEEYIEDSLNKMPNIQSVNKIWNYPYFNHFKIKINDQTRYLNFKNKFDIDSRMSGNEEIYSLKNYRNITKIISKWEMYQKK